jgi:glutamate racemase
MPEKVTRNSPIGVFDSGLGGLTVVKELMRRLPNEDIVYFGDTARVPYGIKSKESVIRFSKECVGVLARHNVKMVVIACNTSSSHALEVLRRIFPLPLIGVIEPGAKKAVLCTQKNKIGVIATQSTVHSGSYNKQLKKLAPRVKVLTKACPLFVPLAEEGWFNREVTARVAADYLKDLKASGVDTVILGCTHYPLLKPVIQKVMGPKVMLVDSAREVALEVKGLLEARDKTRRLKRKAKYLFLVSDEPEHFRKLARRFLNRDLKDVRRSQYV